MLKILPTIRNFMMGLIIAIQVLASPAMALAQSAADSSPSGPVESESVADSNLGGPSSPTGPSAPPGPSGSTYSYNPETGLWENEYYTWDPVTKQTKPKTPQNYSYNPETGKWDTTEWAYDAPSKKYLPNSVSKNSAPAGNTIANTGPDSTNTIDNSSSRKGVFDQFYDASISNRLNSAAVSGNASVIGNTTAGSALSGDAVGVSNFINLIQSTWGVQNTSGLAVFSADINGDVVGDLKLDPTKIVNTGPSSTNIVNDNSQNDLTVDVTGSGLIDNDITISATSGKATVAGNTTAGNAKSGNADVVANLVNVINSSINAGKSFLGVLNIKGNLNGDILLPPHLLKQLIASSAPRATVEINNNQQNSLTANLKSTQNIYNDVNLAATSGNASVTGNTTAGNAKTGNASTNLTLFNLTNREVIGANSLIVFINVLGKWVGLILDAPQGSNTAAYCSGSCLINNFSKNNITFNEDSHHLINNNLDLTASSGDAEVSGNTTAGNATSGNASASANILNISDSRFDLSGWFGMLFINVLGTWNGSFGVNTSAGTVVVHPKSSGGGGGGAVAPHATGVFDFKPKTTVPNQLDSFFQSAVDSNNNADKQSAVAGTASKKTPPAGSFPHKKSWMVPVVTLLVMAGLFSLGALYELIDRFRLNALAYRLNKKTSA